MAGFQKRSLSALSHAWNGDGADAFAVAADTGSGKTEAAALPLIAAAAADRLQGMMGVRSEEHTSELQSLMRISYAVFCLKTTTKYNTKSLKSIDDIIRAEYTLHI